MYVHTHTHILTASKHKLSMLLGVTVPCILSIFSVILFLRLGFVLGNVSFRLPSLYVNNVRYLSLLSVLSLPLSLQFSHHTMHVKTVMITRREWTMTNNLGDFTKGGGGCDGCN